MKPATNWSGCHSNNIHAVGEVGTLCSGLQWSLLGCSLFLLWQHRGHLNYFIILSLPLNLIFILTFEVQLTCDVICALLLPHVSGDFPLETWDMALSLSHFSSAVLIPKSCLAPVSAALVAHTIAKLQDVLSPFPPGPTHHPLVEGAGVSPALHGHECSPRPPHHTPSHREHAGVTN